MLNQPDNVYLDTDLNNVASRDIHGHLTHFSLETPKRVILLANSAGSDQMSQIA